MTNPTTDTEPEPLCEMDAQMLRFAHLYGLRPSTDGISAHLIDDSAILLVGHSTKPIRGVVYSTGRVAWLRRGDDGRWSGHHRSGPGSNFVPMSIVTEADLEALLAWLRGDS
jgi:hypothetical protein